VSDVRLDPARFIELLSREGRILRPDGQRNGRDAFRVRCRVPVVLDCPGGVLRIRDAEAAPEVELSDEQRAEIEAAADAGLIEGIASSTSVDWYETRMHVDALRSMEAQFKRGVDYFPRHHGFLSRVEWDEVIGRSVDARVERASTKAPHEKSDGEFVLFTTIQLDMSEERSKKLIQRIRENRAPGQSIGGWFTEVSVTYDDEGWPTDVLILDVELDHLAAVRSPANPDANKVWLALGKALATARDTEAAEDESKARGRGLTDLWQRHRGAPDQRHITSVTREGDEVVVRFQVDAEEEPEDDDETEEGEELSVPDAAPQAAREDAAGPETAPEPPEQHEAPQGADSANDDTTSGRAGTPPPSTAGEIGRDLEIDMDPKVLAALIASSVQEALAAERAAQGGASPAPANTTDEEHPEERLRAAEARARAAEARARAAEEQLGLDNGSRRTRGGTSDDREAERQRMREEVIREARMEAYGYCGLDMTEVAPQSCRAVARSFGELDMTPELVGRLDGLEPLCRMADADKSGRHLARQVTERHKVLLETPKAISRSVESNLDLREMLSDVIYAGILDGQVRKGSTLAASW
jgi:hypothetical protein